MRNLILYRKVVVLTLTIVLSVLGIQSIGYSQDIDLSEIISENVPPSELSVDQIYNKTLRSLVWVVSKTGKGSGVLIDGELKLAVTNHHVVKDKDSGEVIEVAVFFPARDKRGVLIDDRNFYLNKDNLRILSRLGYATTGRVIAQDPKIDLAIVQLDGLPDTAQEIAHNLSYPTHLYMNKPDQVQIFGNPGGLKLWKWAAGFFQNVDQGMIKINAGIYKGNSGGPGA